MTTTSAETMSTLRALNARFIHNFITNDVAGHDAILHPDFMAIQSNGMRQGRAAYLERWRTGFSPDVYLYWDTRDEQITVVGTVALVRSTNKYIVRRNGTETTGMTAYTDTYVLTDGRWLCLQAQLTPVAPDQWPPDSGIVSVYLKGERQ